MSWKKFLGGTEEDYTDHLWPSPKWTEKWCKRSCYDYVVHHTGFQMETEYFWADRQISFKDPQYSAKVESSFR